MTIKSIYESQDDILNSIKDLYLPEGYECDITYGNGSFWKNLDKPKMCFDIDPLHLNVIQADSTKLGNYPLATSD